MTHRTIHEARAGDGPVILLFLGRSCYLVDRAAAKRCHETIAPPRNRTHSPGPVAKAAAASDQSWIHHERNIL